MTELDIVTGAFSYTGRHMAEQLRARGRRVRSLRDRVDTCLRENADGLGRRYVSELARNFRGQI